MGAKLLVAMATAMLLAGPARTQPAADHRAGVDAWERGDYLRAVERWRKDAAAGDADAQFNLGQAYKLGRGVPLDTVEAERWYAQAAGRGHPQAEDNYGLALFQNGKPREALPWLEKSVARGEPRAQYILGTMLFNGVDVRRDWVRAYALTSRSAAAGLHQATESLHQMDTHLSAAERQQGLVLAKRLDERQAPVATAAASGTGAGRAAAAPPVVVAPPVPRATTRPEPARGGWKLQLGAFGDAGNARRLGGSVAGRFPGRSVDYVKAGSLTRVMVGPFASRAAAQAACGSLKPCVPVGP